LTLPTFIVIGSAKSGTSSLYEYIEGHPQVFMSRIKELQYFCGAFPPELRLDSSLHLGQAWYEQQFAGAGDAIAIGEASTHYTLHPWSAGTAVRMASVIPEARLIYLMRDPVERALSHYVHWVRTGNETLPVEQALRAQGIYLAASRYATQLEEYLAHFSREQVLLLTTDELRDERAATLRRTFEFIGVEPSWAPDALTREFNRASDQRTPRRTLEIARRIPGRHLLARTVPRGVRVATKRRLLTRPTVDPKVAEISHTTRVAIGDELAEDIVGLRRYLGADFHCWGLA